MSPKEFLDRKKFAKKIGEPMEFNRNIGESNPIIYTLFFGSEYFFPDSLVDKTVWEPFAGHTKEGYNNSVEEGRQCGVKVIAYDITPSADNVIKADSTRVCPSVQLDGLFFHPPYHDTKPFSIESGEISYLKGDEYYKAIGSTINMFAARASDDAKVCFVYRPDSNNSDYRIFKMFKAHGFKLHDVKSSYPDYVFLMQR